MCEKLFNAISTSMNLVLIIKNILLICVKYLVYSGDQNLACTNSTFLKEILKKGFRY